MKHRSRGHRVLPMAGAALVDPRTSLQPPGLPPAAAGTHKTVGPTKPRQVLDAPFLRPEPRRKLQKPSHPIPLHRSRHATLRRDGRQEHFENLRYLDRETTWDTPAWSLSAEWFAYLIFQPLLLLFQRVRSQSIAFFLSVRLRIA